MENAGKENSSKGKTKGKGTSPESFKIMGQVRDRKKLKARYIARPVQETVGEGSRRADF